MAKRFAVRIAGPSMLALSAAILAGVSNAPAFAQDTQEAAAATGEVVEGTIAEWGITDAELEADSSVVYGVLDNGMRYALKRNSQPVGEASMRFTIEVGKRDERDDEEGAAHFIEHMAFNGSTNIPEGELVPRLERLGLAFGADTNAETNVHYTMYKLDLPKLDEETVAASLEILREMASELTIAQEAVEREKGIILSEYQVRNTPVRRRVADFLRDVMETPRIGDRVTAEPEATQSLTAETLRGFYEGFYRPEYATLVVVGDFEPAEMEQRIADRFASWKGKGAARETFAPRVAEMDAIKISTFVDPATPELIDLQRVRPHTPATNSIDEFRDELMDQIAAFAITNRLSVLAKEENPRTLAGQAISQDLFKSAKAYGLITVATDGEWPDSMAVGIEEWRRAAEFGFTNSEVNQAKANILSALETAVAQSNSARNSTIASTLALSSVSGTVSQSPEQQLAVYQQVAETITPAAVQENFLAKWGEAPSYAMLAAKAEPEGAQDAIAAVIETSNQVALTKPEETVDAAFAYTDFGTPGEIVSDAMVKDLGIRTIKFANGVELNLKKTDFEPGKISVQAEIGTGLSTVSELPGLALLAQVIASGDDLGAHDADELQRVLSGRQVGYGYSLGQEAVIISASTTPDDLLLQMQLMAGQITDTAFSDQAQRQWAGVAPILATNVRSNAQQMFGVAFQSVLTGGDTRLGFADPSVITQRSMEDLKSVVGSQFASGRIELGIVGDFDEDTAIASVAATLGALDRPASSDEEIAPPSFRVDRGLQTLTHTGQPDQGMIALSWPSDDGFDLRSTLTRRMLSELIGLKAIEVLREELGATYTPNSISSASSVYEGYGHLSLIAPATPASMDEVSRVIRGLISGFVEASPSEDDMLRARQPVLERYERSNTTNSGWVGLVVDAQRRPVRLEDRRLRAEVLASITPDEIQAAAREYLTGEPVEIRVVPTPPEAAE